MNSTCFKATPEDQPKQDIHSDINRSKGRHSRESGNPGKHWIPPCQARGRLSQARNDKVHKTYVVMYNPKAWKLLILILAIAFGLRVFLVINPEVIHNDGTEYVRHAKQILSGDWSGGKAPPLYPLLIALSSFFIKDFELAGIWISIIFGTLIILPVFYLGRGIFNEKVGVISALFASVHPFLYNPSGSVLTESTYHFLLATSVLLGWYAFKQGRFSYILLFSLFTTLAYLTKPEAIGFLFIFSLWVLFINPPDERRHWVKRSGVVFLALFFFLAFSAPYLIQLRNESGRWGISKKISIAMGSFSNEEGVPSIEEIKMKKEFPLLSLINDPLTAFKKIGIGFFNSLYKFQQVLTPLLFLLALLGWIGKKENPYFLKGNLYLMSYLIFFFGFVFPFFWMTRRYTSQMVSISIPWAAYGFLVAIKWVNKRIEAEGSQKRIQWVLLIFLSIGLFIQGNVMYNREHRLIQKEVGLWMRDHLPRGEKMMSRLPQEAFYAELSWVRMPQAEYKEILQVARSSDVRYLVIDEEINKNSPGFWENIKGEELVSLKDSTKKDQRTVVFEIVYPKREKGK